MGGFVTVPLGQSMFLALLPSLPFRSFEAIKRPLNSSSIEHTGLDKQQRQLLPSNSFRAGLPLI